MGKTYVVQYRAHVRTRFVTLGHRVPVTPDHARKLALGVLAEVAGGGDTPLKIAGRAVRR